MHVDDITAHTAQLALLQIIVVFESVIPTDPVPQCHQMYWMMGTGELVEVGSCLTKYGGLCCEQHLPGFARPCHRGSFGWNM